MNILNYSITDGHRVLFIQNAQDTIDYVSNEQMMNTVYLLNHRLVNTTTTRHYHIMPYNIIELYTESVPQIVSSSRVRYTNLKTKTNEDAHTDDAQRESKTVNSQNISLAFVATDSLCSTEREFEFQTFQNFANLGKRRTHRHLPCS